MATTLATARGDAYTTLSTAFSTNANGYKRVQTNYQFPCFVVGWPEEYDPRADMGTAHDFTLNVLLAHEVTDDDSSDDALSSFLETAISALQANKSWDVLPITDFESQQTADDRVVIWCRLPVAILA